MHVTFACSMCVAVMCVAVMYVAVMYICMYANDIACISISSCTNRWFIKVGLPLVSYRVILVDKKLQMNLNLLPGPTKPSLPYLFCTALSQLYKCILTGYAS